MAEKIATENVTVVKNSTYVYVCMRKRKMKQDFAINEFSFNMSRLK
jgi:hypothetical protein